MISIRVGKCKWVNSNKIAPQQHVHWRSLSYYERELKHNVLDIIYLAPMYCLLMSPVDTSGLLGKMLIAIYYSLTCRLTLISKTFPIIVKTYLTVLYYFDSFLTLFSFGVSTKLLVAKKRDLGYV